MKTLKTACKKALAMFLVVIMLVMILPVSVYADAIDSLDILSDEKNDTDLVKNMFEDVNLREEYVKHFRLEDGSFVAAQYEKPVHYLDEDGVWKDIDNTLLSDGSEYSTSNARIKFAEKITGNEVLVTVHDGNRKIAMSLDGAIKKTQGKVIKQNVDDDNFTELQKMMTLDNLSSEILYEDILKSVDVQYIIDSYDVKENIIVKEKTGNYTYSFTLQLNNLVAELNENGDVIISDPSSEDVEYVIPAPIAYDATGEYIESADIYYTLNEIGNKTYNLVVTVDTEWMEADERVYPIVVDPSIRDDSSVVTDLYINSSSESSSYSTSSYLYVSETRISYWKSEALPTIPHSAYISDAQISLWAYSTYGNYVGAYQVLSDWDSTLTWNKTIAIDPEGSLSGELLDYNCINSESGSIEKFTWNITELAREWYDGTDNYGVAFRIVDETTPTGSIQFRSNEYSNAAYRPSLIITYRDMKGLESYWSYASQNIGLAGTANVNYANGALTLVIPTLTTTDRLFSYTPSLVYNTANIDMDTQTSTAQSVYFGECMPLGFRFSFQETIIQRQYLSPDHLLVNYYVWSDSDGTEHYFVPIDSGSSLYQDEDGLMLILDASATNLTITDTSKTVKTFTKRSTVTGDGVLGGWYLTKITDANNNQLIFTYDSALRPTKIDVKPNGSAQIHYFDILYNEYNMPYVIWNYTSREGILFKYSSTPTANISNANTKYLEKSYTLMAQMMFSSQIGLIITIMAVVIIFLSMLSLLMGMVNIPVL